MTGRDSLGPPDRSLYWGDFHKHLTGPGADVDRLDAVVGAAARHLDISTVLCYPFKWFRKGREGGIREETWGHDPEYEAWWEEIQRVAADRNDPGAFVTFPAYEWHGNRTRWGDHNVLYREEGHPIEATADLPDVYDALRDRPALALPHHTGYRVGSRGKDWDAFDPELSPVMEVYSSHGSSEGVGTPVPMDDNPDMGPRTSGGTLRDALDRGHRVGVIASNDGPGLPGTWGRGLAGVWATELTREGVWDALRERRTYGVTGDRIRLWWTLDGAPMGSTVEGPPGTARVAVDCPRPLDRIELVGDGAVVDTYVHPDARTIDGDGTYRQVVELGWGPNGAYGDFEDVAVEWRGELRVEGGRLRAVTPRFAGLGQDYERRDGAVRFDCRTWRGGDADVVLPEADDEVPRQGFVLAYDADDDAELVVDLDDGPTVSTPAAEARGRARVVPLLEESRARLEREFELGADDIENPDVVYHNARKVTVGPASPRPACAATVAFEELAGAGYYYVRASQVDGQYAWSSPIWVA